jgi:hypothetical protein
MPSYDEEAAVNEHITATHFMDLKSVIPDTHYTDWEGFAVWDEVCEAKLEVNLRHYYYTQPIPDHMRLLVKHYIYECVDQAEVPTDEDVQSFICHVEYVLNSRYWMKSEPTLAELQNTPCAIAEREAPEPLR